MGVALLSSSIGYNSVAVLGLSTDLDNYAVDYTREFLKSSPHAGAVTFKDIITPVKFTTAGVRETAYSDLFYNRIWVIPARNDLGNMIGRRVITVEVWNSYTTSKTLAGVSSVGLDNTAIAGPLSGVFNAYQERIYSITVEVTGNPVLEGYYEWDFTSEQVRSAITARRVTVFPFRVNTAGGIKERLQWLTTVTDKKRGREQRRKLRANPRRKIEYNHTFFDQNERQRFRALMFGWQGRVFGLPIWLDRQKLAAQLNAGATSITVDTVYRDYDSGSNLILWNGYGSYEVVAIDSVSAGSVALGAPTQNTWPVGTYVMPLRLATLSPELSSAMHKRNFETATLLWQIANQEVSTNRIANASYDTYKGYPVYAQGNDWSNELTVGFKAKEQIFDTLVGAYNIMAETTGNVSTVPYSVFLSSRQKIAEFFGFLKDRAGRFSAVWLPSFQDDFTLQATIGPSDTTVLVTANGYSSLFALHEARRDVCFIRSSGQRTTGALSALPITKDTLTLDSALGFTLTPGDGTRICFLTLCRLDQR
jgi:hypothetical protein